MTTCNLSWMLHPDVRYYADEDRIWDGKATMTIVI